MIQTTDAERLVSRAQRAARSQVARELGRATGSGNLAADRIADAVIRAIGYRDPDQWPSREAIEKIIADLNGRA